MIYLILSIVLFIAFVIVLLSWKTKPNRIDYVINRFEKEKLMNYRKQQTAYFEEYMRN